MDRLIEKRVNKELTNFKYILNKEDKTNGKFTLEFDFSNNNKQYNIKLSLDNYPFNPPSYLFINNKRILYSSFSFPNSLINNYILKYKKYPSQITILCEYNWNHTLTILDIVNEYFNFINDLKNIKYELEVNKIMLKIKLPDEIIVELLSFLF